MPVLTRASLLSGFACFALAGSAFAAEASPTPSPWMPDLGDQTYKNPVLFADYSDPDAIRVGDDFWLVSSSFNHTPGLPILHSRDLVNWTLVNHALPVQVPADHFAVPRHGEGVWAPAIRFHDGKYYIYYPDPDYGIYVVTATDPRGRWSEPVLVKGGKGLIDPCPLWDDRQVYLIHGWAKSRSGKNNQITLNKLSADGAHVTDGDGVVIIDENTSGRNMHTLEGPKIYKRNGEYWIFAPVNGVPTGEEAVYRAKTIRGPYQVRLVLAQGSTPTNGPHQGAWVDTPAGENWFLHFQDRGPFGRVVHLEPMSWRADGWPAMGTAAATGAEQGEPVLTYQKPDTKVPHGFAATAPATSDEFDAPELGLQWQWQANPKPEYASLAANKGSLRLACVAAPAATSLYNAPQLLLQKFSAPEFTATTVLNFTPGAASDAAGLMVFGYSYAWIGLRQTASGPKIVQVTNVDASKNGADTETASAEAKGNTVYLRVSIDAGAKCRFAYSFDGETFTPLGGEFQATVGRWVGAKVGLFAAGAPGATSGGHADFDWFRLTP